MKTQLFLRLFILLFPIPLFSQFLYQKTEGDRVGLVNQNGQWIVRPAYDYIYQRSDFSVLAGSGDTVFMISQSGDIKRFPGYKKIKQLKVGFTLLHVSGKWHVFNNAGILVVDQLFNQVFNLGDYIEVRNGKEAGLLDSGFQWVFPLGIQRIEQGRDNVVYLFKDSATQFYFPGVESVNGTKAMINEQGHLVYNGPSYFCLRARKNRKYRVFDRNGQLLQEVRVFKEVYSDSIHLIFTDDENTYCYEYGNNEPKLVLNGCTSGLLCMKNGNNTLVVSYNKRLIFNQYYKILFEDSFYFVSSIPVGFIVYTRKGQYWFDQSLNKVNAEPLVGLEVLSPDMYSFLKNDSRVLHVVPTGFEIELPATGELEVEKNKVFCYTKNHVKIVVFDEAMDWVETINYNHVWRVKAGTKSMNNSMPAMGGGGGGVFNSNSDRYFYFNQRYGLLSSSSRKDTLIQPLFSGVEKWNDSVDVVYIGGVGRSVGKQESLSCGFLNNRTGKYLVAPQLDFVSLTDLRDSALGFFRVIFARDKQVLFKKADLKPVKETVADYIGSPSEGYFPVHRGVGVELIKRGNDSKSGIKRNGKYKLPVAEYFYYSSFLLNVEEVWMKANWCNYINPEGQFIFHDTLASKLAFLKPMLLGVAIAYDKKAKAGVLDQSGRWVAEPEYAEVFRLKGNDSILLLQSKEMKYGYLSTDGRELTQAVYSKAEMFKQGLALVVKDSLSYILNKAAEEKRMEIKFTDSKPFSGGYAAFKVTRNWVFADSNGHVYKDIAVKNSSGFVNGVCAVMSKNGKWGAIDERFKFVVEPQYEKLAAENENYLVFKNDDNYHFYFRDGAEIKSLKLKDAEIQKAGSDGFLRIKGKRVTLLDSSGKRTGKVRSGNMIWTSGDSVFVLSNSHFFLYQSGKKVLSVSGKFNTKNHQRKTIAFKKEKGIWAFEVNRAYHFLCPSTFPDTGYMIRLSDFPGFSLVKENLYDCIRLNAFIYKNNETGSFLADSLGNKLNEDNLFHLSYAGNDLFRASVIDDFGREVCGLMNRYGVWIMPPAYQQISDFNEGLAVYGMSTNFTMVNLQGARVVDRDVSEISQKGDYYFLRSDSGFAWWSPSRGWLTSF